MKYIENSDTWELIISALDRVVGLEREKGDAEEIKEKCEALAAYSYEADIKTGKISEHELLKMERAGEVFGSNIFVRMKRHYCILSKMQGSELSAQIQLLTNLHAYLGNGFYYKAEARTAEELLSYGLMLPDLSLDMPEPQLDRMTDALKLLEGYGIRPRLEHGGLVCDAEQSRKLFDLIDKKTDAIGGNYVLEKVFREFFAEYIPVFDLYNISRNKTNERNEPVNLLLNLSVKHMRADAVYADLSLTEKKAEEVLCLARAWLDVLDIQSDSGVEYSMMRTESFPLYFSNEIIFDKMCMPRQYSKRYILLLLEHLIKPFFEKAERKYSFKEYCRVSEYLMSQKAPCLFVSAEDVRKKTGVANYKIRLIFEDISRPVRELNRNFTSLEGETNFCARPLIRFPLGKYLYIDYHFTGFGFYLAAYDMIKAKFDILDREIGPLAEKMLRSELSKKGYSFSFGKYSAHGDESDCDLVMSDSGRIFFIEVKKTDIENEFNALDDVAALERLSKGMVKAQKQALRHKKNLLKNKKLLLKSEAGEKELTYSGNEGIYMFSVCLPEYSFLTSKTFSSKLTEVILLGGFSAVERQRQHELEELNGLGKVMLQYSNEIYNNALPDVHSLSFYSAFASAQQLLTALWCSKDQSEFLEMMRNWIYGTDTTLNLYHSILFDIAAREVSGNIRKSAIDMLERTKKEAVFVGWNQ